MDILLFRIENPDGLRKSKISYDIFIEIDTLIASFSKQHQPDLFEYSVLYDDLDYIQDYCFTTIDLGNPLTTNVFKFNLSLYSEMVQYDYSEEEAKTKITDKEKLLPRRNELITTAIEDFSVNNYFSADEQLFIHYLDDSEDSHGCINMPWKISIGLNYALLELRQGIWG